MKRDLKAAFLINSMEGGGAEKVVQILLKNLITYQNTEITLILIEDNIKYEIPKGIKVISLFSHINNYLAKFLSLFFGAYKLKKTVRRCGITTVISFLERSNFINVLSKIIGSPHRLIISEHTNPEYSYVRTNIKASIVKFLLKLLYKRSDKIIAVSNGVKKTLNSMLGIAMNKIHVIYDPCDINKVKKLSVEDVVHPWFYADIPIIITVGRLVEPKGQWHLIQTFAEVQKDIRSRLMIIGEGILQNKLEKLARSLNVSEDVAFLGWQANPYKYMSRSTIFVLTSLWEGFGIILVEAMVCGLPIVSFDCESGPREILDNGKYGILVPVGDNKTLKNAIVNLLKDYQLRATYTRITKQRAQKFNMEAITEKYKRCLEIP
jgi:glycosyltransferase involved in cell wall biosynthesis